MTMKFILITAAIAAFALTGGSLAVTGDAFAKDGKNSSSTSHAMKVGGDTHRDRDHSDTHRDHDHSDAHQHDYDYKYVHQHEHDHSRHFWHGTWWDYGIGPCWRWSHDYDEYLWVCD